MNQNKPELKLTSTETQKAISVLIQMNDVVGNTISSHNSTRDKVLNLTIKKAYHYTTQTEIDFKKIDRKMQDALLVLLLEAKLAYDYFRKGCEDSEIIRLLKLTNNCAAEQLRLLKK